MIFLWKLIHILNYHGDKKNSNKTFPAKKDAVLQSNHTGTDMVNFNSFGGVLMPNYQEQNTHLFGTNSYTPYII